MQRDFQNIKSDEEVKVLGKVLEDPRGRTKSEGSNNWPHPWRRCCCCFFCFCFCRRCCCRSLRNCGGDGNGGGGDCLVSLNRRDASTMEPLRNFTAFWVAHGTSNLEIYYFCFLWRCGTPRVIFCSLVRFLEHTQRRTTVLWKRDQLFAETSIWQHITGTTDKHP